ncbi:hypothetical protein ACFWPQ_46110 [Streptomyces sp. NPDC058464]|uniref:hypothetical protein n=1 Tax=Streptomyces sp. NPDC058464 TaxID=3346511 RepID=UPI003662C62C
MDCVVGTGTKTVDLTVNVEQLALAAGVIEGRGEISYSARNLTQLRKSLSGQAKYVRLVHPLLADKATEPLMRQAGAREWKKPARP